jgi:DNA-binding CsgD family transcriptional regulator
VTTAPAQAGPSSSSGGPVPSLSAQEVKYLRLLAQGETIQEIARAWHYEESSARSIGLRIREKLGARTNAQALYIAVELKILDPTRRHGDHAGFAAHRYHNEEPCEECWEGERAYRRARRTVRRAVKQAAERPGIRTS